MQRRFPEGPVKAEMFVEWMGLGDGLGEWTHLLDGKTEVREN